MSGLIYLRARYYDPKTASFLTPDPLRDATKSVFGYTAGNPLQYVDPLGLAWWESLLDQDRESIVNNALQSFGAGFADSLIGVVDVANVLTGGGDPGDLPTIGNPNACNSIYDWSYTIGGVVPGVLAAVAGAARPIPKAATQSSAASEAVVASIDDVLVGLPRGRNSGVRAVQSDDELGEIWSQLTAGARAVEAPADANGVWYMRPDGVRVSLRGSSLSGGRTIDINFPNGRNSMKVHIK